MTERTNSITATAANLNTISDEVFAAKSLVASALAPNPALVSGFQHTKTGKIPTVAVDGLGDYGSSGYVRGAITVSYTDYTLSRDRGRQFLLDQVDIMTQNGVLTATGVISEFVRTKVVPEVDANAIAAICQKVIANQGTITSHKGNRIEYNYTPAAATIVGKVLAMLNAVKGRTGEEEGYHIFVNAAYRTYFETSTEVTKTKNVNGDGALAKLDARSLALNGEPLVFVPAARMYSKIDMYDGSTSGEEAGSYIKDATTGKDVVAVVVKDGSVMSITAHAVTKINPDPDNYDGVLANFRAYYDTLVLAQKLDGCEVLIKDSEA